MLSALFFLLLRNGLCGAELSPTIPQNQRTAPPGKPGLRGHYRLEQSGEPARTTVVRFSLAYGPVESAGSQPTRQWLYLDATKASGESFRVWLLSSEYPSPELTKARKTVARYLLQEGTARPSEFRNRFTQEAVLPMTGAWSFLFPQADPNGNGQGTQLFPAAMRFLGHRYELAQTDEAPEWPAPVDPRVVELLPDVLVGAASNTRQKEDRRRYDNSDYELVRLTEEDYRQMFNAGMNCFKVDAQQLPWVEELDAFYWGVSAAELPYPESLYRSTYLGPTLFVDEPAVGTRDYVIRPKLAKEESFRKSISPQSVFDAFREYFGRALKEGAPQIWFNSLKGRADVDPGTLKFNQENLFSWETMVSSSAYELSQDPRVPAAMVFEPPGRVGTRRTVPEWDMSYGCQLPADDPNNLIDVVYGFLRGAARLTGKSWGTSIYGAVDRADAFWFLTHAYDLGATRFFFWDNFRSACVPYSECLALAGALRRHAENFPNRDLGGLKRAAEVAILLPPGYNLGHVQLGKGNLWGLGELNLERLNHAGVKYRVVMGNFFTEIERCRRLGVGFDLLWDLPGLQLTGYRESIRVREDGRVQVRAADGAETVLEHARAPARPSGAAPALAVELSSTRGRAPLGVTARAQITETSAPVYYTLGPDSHGVCHNVSVDWELYGPNEEDYRFLTRESSRPLMEQGSKQIKVETSFTLTRPGRYRLRAATVDTAGRSTVEWNSIEVSD